MKTARVIIDIDKRKHKAHAQYEEVNFDVFEARRHPSNAKEYFRVDVLDKVCTEQERVYASETVNGQRLKHYFGGEILKSNCGCKSVFARAMRVSPGRNLQRKKEKMWNCNSRPSEAGFASAKIRGAYWNGFA